MSSHEPGFPTLVITGTLLVAKLAHQMLADFGQRKPSAAEVDEGSVTAWGRLKRWRTSADGQRSEDHRRTGRR
jgi:hypothetical protein